MVCLTIIEDDTALWHGKQYLGLYLHENIFRQCWYLFSKGCVSWIDVEKPYICTRCSRPLPTNIYNIINSGILTKGVMLRPHWCRRKHGPLSHSDENNTFDPELHRFFTKNRFLFLIYVCLIPSSVWRGSYYSTFQYFDPVLLVIFYTIIVNCLFEPINIFIRNKNGSTFRITCATTHEHNHR